MARAATLHNLARTDPWDLAERMSAVTTLVSLAVIDIYGAVAAGIFVLSATSLVALALRSGAPKPIEILPLLFPLYVLASAPWSDEPLITLRYGIQLAITFAAAVAMTRTLTAEAALRVLALALVATLPLHILLGDNAYGAWRGLFASKNFFALRMSLTMFAALYLMADAGLPRSVRWLGVPAMAVGAYAIAKSDSAGATVATAASLAVFLVVLTFSGMPRRPRAVLMVTGGGLAVAMAMIALLFRDDLFNLLIDFFDKDRGLTGRDYLWARADQYIAENPLLGTGFAAFWVQGRVEAEGLWRALYIGSRSGFNFHHLYRNVLVETGFIGFAFVALAIIGTIVATLRWVIVRPTPAAAFFACLTVAFLARSVIEVDYPVAFGFVTFLVTAGWMYAAQFQVRSQ